MVAECINTLREQVVPETHHVQLSVAPNGLIITKHDPRDENNIDVRLSFLFSQHILTFSQLLMQVSIRAVSYSGADAKDKKLFAFVSNDIKTKAMVCHIFKTKSGVCRHLQREIT